MTLTTLRLPLFALCALLLIAGCTPKVATRGHLLDPEKMAEIKVGESTREDVMNKIGSPTQVSTFDENTWLYFGRSTEQYSFLDPKITASKAVEIKFNDIGIVTAINELDPKAAQDVSPVSRSTPTYGHDMTFVEQLVGNLGSRVGKESKKK